MEKSQNSLKGKFLLWVTSINTCNKRIYTIAVFSTSFTHSYFQGWTQSSSACVPHTRRRFPSLQPLSPCSCGGRRPKYNNLLVYFYMVLSLKFKIPVSPSVGHRYMCCGLKSPLQETPLLMCNVSVQVTLTLDAKHQVFRVYSVTDNDGAAS